MEIDRSFKGALFWLTWGSYQVFFLLVVFLWWDLPLLVRPVDILLSLIMGEVALGMLSCDMIVAGGAGIAWIVMSVTSSHYISRHLREWRSMGRTERKIDGAVLMVGITGLFFEIVLAVCRGRENPFTIQWLLIPGEIMSLVCLVFRGSYWD